jgi:MSHA biogenesis protein MshP
MMNNRIEDRGLRIELESGAGLTRSSFLDPQSSKGFSLISAIFLLVVIAALGTFAVTISTTQHMGAAQDVMGARAYQAARAGIEWGAYRLLITGGGCGVATQNLPAGTLAGTLSGFSVTVQCSAISYDEGERTAASGNPLWVYQLTSTAMQGAAGTASYVEREIKAVIAK